MGRAAGRWLAIVAGGALLAIAIAIVIRVQVAIPGDAASVPIARAALSGPLGQPSSPSGQACLDRMTSGSGWLDLCWSAYRLGDDTDTAKDYYVLRLYGSHQGLRWLVVRSQLVGIPGNDVYDVWPDGTYDGSCRREPVSMLVPLSALAEDDVCGRTEAHLELAHWSHRLVWRCEGCLVPDSLTRGLSMYAVIGLPSGTIPAWDVFADPSS